MMNPPAVPMALLLIALAVGPVSGQPAATHDAALQAKLEHLVEGFRGEVGVYVRHLPSGREAALHPDTLFPTASLIKAPILLKTFDAIEQGKSRFTAMTSNSGAAS